jgi:hypothetical protein
MNRSEKCFWWITIKGLKAESKSYSHVVWIKNFFILLCFYKEVWCRTPSLFTVKIIMVILKSEFRLIHAFIVPPWLKTAGTFLLVPVFSSYLIKSVVIIPSLDKSSAFRSENHGSFGYDLKTVVPQKAMHMQPLTGNGDNRLIAEKLLRRL